MMIRVNEPPTPISRWPVSPLVGLVGLWVGVVPVLWLYGHLIQGEPIEQTA